MANNTSKIAVRARPVPISRDDPYAGSVMDSMAPRTTEIDALKRIAYGDPIPATDTIGEALRAGKIRCPRCCQFKEPEAYTTYKRKGYDRVYRKTYCRKCLVEMERLKRFSKVEPVEVYPRRVE